MTETHWRKVHRRMNENLLFAEDLGGLGAKPVDVEIIDSGVILVKGADDSKNMPWLAFQGGDGKPRQKRLALNVTNAKTMQALTGTGIIERWRGWITLVVVTTRFFDQKTKEMASTEVIRIAPKRPDRASSKSGPISPPKDEPPPPPPPPEQKTGWTGDSPIDPEEARLIAEKEATNAGR